MQLLSKAIRLTLRFCAMVKGEPTLTGLRDNVTWIRRTQKGEPLLMVWKAQDERNQNLVGKSLGAAINPGNNCGMQSKYLMLHVFNVWSTVKWPDLPQASTIGLTDAGGVAKNTSATNVDRTLSLSKSVQEHDVDAVLMRGQDNAACVHNSRKYAIWTIPIPRNNSSAC